MRTLKIKKVDDKPMVIHTKEKAKIHTVQSVMVAYGIAKPIIGTVSKTSEAMKQAMLEKRKRKLKVVKPGKKVASKATKGVVKKTTKKVAKDSSKKVAKDTAKGVAKKVAKDTTKGVAKTATTAATTAAGTALAPGIGTAVGVAARYVAGVAVEQKDMQVTNRNHKIKFFLDKMNAQDKQTDSIAKLVKDLLVKRGMTMLKQVAPIIGMIQHHRDIYKKIENIQYALMPCKKGKTIFCKLRRALNYNQKKMAELMKVDVKKLRGWKVEKSCPIVRLYVK